MSPVLWLFAAVMVLAMGAVAVVAAGNGGEMEPAYDDRPDVTLPREGELSADDLRGLRFTIGFRGYRTSEVDAVIARLIAERDNALASSKLPDDATPSGHDG